MKEYEFEVVSKVQIVQRGRVMAENETDAQIKAEEAVQYGDASEPEIIWESEEVQEIVVSYKGPSKN